MIRALVLGLALFDHSDKIDVVSIVLHRADVCDIVLRDLVEMDVYAPVFQTRVVGQVDNQNHALRLETCFTRGELVVDDGLSTEQHGSSSRLTTPLPGRHISDKLFRAARCVDVQEVFVEGVRPRLKRHINAKIGSRTMTPVEHLVGEQKPNTVVILPEIAPLEGLEVEPWALLASHDINAFGGLTVGQYDEDEAREGEYESSKRENQDAESPYRHLLLRLQILFGGFCFLYGGYGLYSALKRVERDNDTGAGVEAILYAPIFIGGYLIAIIGIVMSQF